MHLNSCWVVFWKRSRLTSLTLGFDYRELITKYEEYVNKSAPFLILLSHSWWPIFCGLVCRRPRAFSLRSTNEIAFRSKKTTTRTKPIYFSNQFGILTLKHFLAVLRLFSGVLHSYSFEQLFPDLLKWGHSHDKEITCDSANMHNHYYVYYQL